MTKDIKKEFIFGIRSSRFLIIAAAFTFLGLLTPIMLKILLPMIFSSQFPGMDDSMIAQMVDMSHRGSLQGFFNDLFEMGTLIVAFTLCGLLAQELKDNTLVIPLCSGKSFSNIVLAKTSVFAMLLTVSTVAAASISYLYSGLLFEFEVKYLPLLQASLIHSLYLIFLLTCLLLFGSLTSKPIATGLITLVITYVLQAIGSMLDINKWLPSGLISQAQSLGYNQTADPTGSAGLDVAGSAGLDVASSAAVETAGSTGLDVASSAGLDVASSAAVETAGSTGLDVASSAGYQLSGDLAITIAMTVALIIIITATTILRLRTMEHNRR